MAADRKGVLITRPAREAEETALRVAALGWQPVLAPVMIVARLKARFPEAPQAVLVTSANALSGIPRRLHTAPLFAVGNATAGRARALGFRQIMSADGDAVALARLVAARRDPAAGALVLATGRGLGGALASALRAAGFTVACRSTYATEPAPCLPEAAKAALEAGSLRAALFFSAETVRIFINLSGSHAAALRDVAAVAMGNEAATVLATAGWRTIRIAKLPTQDEMLALIE
jgi:uroporphyrinogen-III synthase